MINSEPSMNYETTNVLYRQLFWVSIGLTLDAIIAIRKPLLNSFLKDRHKEVQMYIIAKNEDLIAIIKDFTPIDNENFDGIRKT